tara:strand:+ start:1440 stop:2075 length:636 start_codon:yes stop_codon:yes gene_type:complete
MFKTLTLILIAIMIFITSLSFKYDKKYSYYNLLSLNKIVINNINENQNDVSELAKTLKKLNNEQIYELYNNNEFLVNKIISNEIYFTNEDKNSIFSKGIWWNISLKILYDLYPMNEVDTLLPSGSRVRISNLNTTYNEKVGTVIHNYPNSDLVYFKKNSIGNVILDDNTTLYNVPYKNIEIVNLTLENEYPNKIYEDNPIPSMFYIENDSE